MKMKAAQISQTYYGTQEGPFLGVAPTHRKRAKK
jgi:hypothetical protein